MSLFLVSTPIGNLGDMTFRALDVLKDVDKIACEDTRVTAKLLSHFQFSKPLLSYHDHNGHKMRPYILSLLEEGMKIALVSDAGTPLISDPGYKLVCACYEKNIKVTCLPGASSILPALLLSGFPPYPFMFCGFVKNDMAMWKDTQATLLFFESANRLVKTLSIMKTKLSNRQVAVARELTKFYEECVRGSYDEVIAHYEKNPPRGEVVIVLDHFIKTTNENHIQELLKNHENLKGTELTKKIMKETGLSRDEAYKMVVGAVGIEPTTR